jgi:hypothetical protein
MYYNKSRINKCISSDKLIVEDKLCLHLCVFYITYCIVFYTQKHMHLCQEALSIQENVWKVNYYNVNIFRNTLI